jgi:hypothetical protein
MKRRFIPTDFFIVDENPRLFVGTIYAHKLIIKPLPVSTVGVGLTLVY